MTDVFSLSSEVFGLLLSLALLWGAVYVVKRLAGKRVEEILTVRPLYLYIKTRRLNRIFLGFSLSWRRHLVILFTLGAILGALLTTLSVLTIAQGVINLLVKPAGEPAVVPLIPGLTVTVDTFLKMIPAIALVVIPHEFAHKIAFHASGVPVKSVGAGLAVLLPFAFVEPDNERFKKSSEGARARILAAGSLANVAIAGLLAPLVVYPGVYALALSPLYGPPSGILVQGVDEDGPLGRYTHIRAGDVIVAINGTKVSTIMDYLEMRIPPNATLVISYIKAEDLGSDKPVVRNERLVTDPHPLDPRRGIIGILVRFPWPLTSYYPPRLSWLSPHLPNTLYEVLFWAFVLSFSVGLFNMLPIPPLDGFGFLDSSLGMLGLRGRKREVVMRFISALTLGLLLVNLIVPWIPR